MVSVLQANFITCRVGFVLSCFFKSKFSCSLLWRERYSRPFHWALTLSINTRVVDRAAIEPNRTESQVRSRKLELGSWKSEVGSWKSEVGNRKWEVGSGKSEVGNGKSEVGSRKWELWEVGSGRFEGLAIQLWVWTVRNQKPSVRTLSSLKSEFWSWKSEVGSRKLEVGSLKLEVGSPKSEDPPRLSYFSKRMTPPFIALGTLLITLSLLEIELYRNWTVGA